jgi:hypothetical protein
MKDEDSRPYFLRDEPLTIRQLREILRSGSEQERLAYMAKILREARYEDVWEFLSVDDLVRHWEQLAPCLGRRCAFWEFLLRKWRELGLLV